MDKRKRTLILVGGIVVLALGVGAFVRSRPHDLVLIGVVDANEIVVTPPVQARLDSLWVEEGTEVKAGQPIASLDRGELAAQAQAAGASAASLRAQLDQVSLSAQQTAGEATSAVAAARARLAVARAESARQEAELTRERADEGRATKLASSGGLSPQELERATTALQVQEQVVNAAHESLRAAEADVQRAEAGELAVRRRAVASPRRRRG